MIEPVARDGASRITSWSRADSKRLTPLALAAELPDAPAPADRLVLAREPRIRDTVIAGGSRFSRSGAETTGFLVIDDDLPYPPAAGADLMRAGHEENYQEHIGDRAFVALDPTGNVPSDAEVVALGAARALLDDPYTFAKAVTTLRETIGPERLLYAPGCGLPHEIALLAYVGVDILDDASAVLAARQGAYLTPEGPIPAAIARESGLPGADDLVAHARGAVQHELARVHAAIRGGKLRELVESRTRATPNLAAQLRRLDKECYHFFESRTPLIRQGPLYATSAESLDRPEMVRFRRRLARRYEKPASARILVLLPCSQRKPYALSKTHKILFSALDRVRNRGAIHEVILTSPLGVVPRELETTYPAAHYDLPVTGHWGEDEKAMIREAVTALLARSRYDAIVVHLDEVEMEIIAPVIGDFHYTSEGQPLAPHSLENLATTLNKLADAFPRVRGGVRVLDDMTALARFQFGEAGQSLVEGAAVRGKMPFIKIIDSDSGEQLAMTTEDRGYLSLALEGGRRMMEAGMYRVEIDDFRPSGTIFAVGVRNADAEIAPEDDVLLHHNGEFRGVGRALVSGLDMGRMRKGGCVSVRHRAEVAKGAKETKGAKNAKPGKDDTSGVE